MPAHPDAQLHPVATGLAKGLVDQHQADQPLKLYAGWFCPYVSPYSDDNNLFLTSKY
jgi:glutathione S-transferase